MKIIVDFLPIRHNFIPQDEPDYFDPFMQALGEAIENDGDYPMCSGEQTGFRRKHR